VRVRPLRSYRNGLRRLYDAGQTTSCGASKRFGLGDRLGDELRVAVGEGDAAETDLSRSGQDGEGLGAVGLAVGLAARDPSPRSGTGTPDGRSC
jgi:hypothetical protein